MGYKDWFVDSEIIAPDQRNKVLKDDITFTVTACTRKGVQQFFKSRITH